MMSAVLWFFLGATSVVVGELIALRSILDAFKDFFTGLISSLTGGA